MPLNLNPFQTRFELWMWGKKGPYKSSPTCTGDFPVVHKDYDSSVMFHINR